MTSRTNRQLVLDIRQVLAELETLSEAKAAGVVAFSGSSTKAGHKVLWTERDTGPGSLHEVFIERFRRVRGDLEQIEETLIAAQVALKDAQVRPRHQRIDGDWKALFVEREAGTHYVAAALGWGIHKTYAQKLRQRHGVGPTWGGPFCNKCRSEMHLAEGVVPIWRCEGCAREIPKEPPLTIV